VEEPLPSPTVFSVEPGVYLDGVTGVRIEDLVAIDATARRVELLTTFPREVCVVGS
jgi:Xaa-Pro dipeptidase